MKIKRKPFMNAVMTRPESITQLAVKAGISSTTLYNAFHTERTSLETLTKLCKVIGGKPADFIDYTFKAPSPTVAINVEALEALRIQFYLTQKALAAEVGITKSAFWFIKHTGRTRRSTLGKLAKALCVKVEELIEGG